MVKIKEAFIGAAIDTSIVIAKSSAIATVAEQFPQDYDLAIRTGAGGVNLLLNKWCLGKEKTLESALIILNSFFIKSFINAPTLELKAKLFTGLMLINYSCLLVSRLNNH